MKTGMAPNIALAIVFFAAAAAIALRAAVRRPQPLLVSGPDRLNEPADAVERTQTIFHELHADGRNAACAVCDSQYRSA